MNIELVVAAALNNVIGKDKQIPWHLSEDLKHFKELTLNQTILMGRRTFESIGRPLPMRHNFVLTKDRSLAQDGITIVSSIEEAKAKCTTDKLMVIGGQRLYEETIAEASKIHLTRILCNFDGDTKFPSFDDLGFIKIDESEIFFSEENSFDFVFETYTK